MQRLWNQFTGAISYCGAGLAATCSFGLLHKNKDSGPNGASIFQLTGIATLKNVHLDTKGPKTFGLNSASKSRRIRAMASPNVSAPKREKDPKKRVVITGMGVVSVFGNDVDKFYDKLLEGESGISLIDSFDVSNWPVKIAGHIRNFSSEGYIDPKVDRRLDDCWRYSMVAGKKALEDANLTQQVLDTMDRSRIGVLVGTAFGGVTAFSDGVQSLMTKGHKKVTPFLVPYLMCNIGPALLAIDMGLGGPNYSISTACSSATAAIFAAANHIRRGDADVMVTGGTEAAATPEIVSGLLACGALSWRNDEPQKACRPWDKDRDGLVSGEGCGLLVMESLEHAMKRGANIIGEYLGGAVNCDCHHITSPKPDGFKVAACLAKSLEDAGVSPEEVNYVNPHATGTRVGDLAEVNAIKKVFKDTSQLKMNATKSLIGHPFGAAGGLEAVVTIKAINTGWLHPTLNQYNLEPEVTIDTVPNVKKQHEITAAISCNLGFGGQNTSVVFAPFKP